MCQLKDPRKRLDFLIEQRHEGVGLFCSFFMDTELKSTETTSSLTAAVIRKMISRDLMAVYRFDDSELSLKLYKTPSKTRLTLGTQRRCGAGLLQYMIVCISHSSALRPRPPPSLSLLQLVGRYWRPCVSLPASSARCHCLESAGEVAGAGVAKAGGSYARDAFGCAAVLFIAVPSVVGDLWCMEGRGVSEYLSTELLTFV